MLSEKDSKEVVELGFSLETVENQLEQFKQGFPFLMLKAPATISNGILKVDGDQQSTYVEKYDAYQGKVVKFVPASGAATRMFKSLYEAKALFEKGEAVDSVFTRFPDVKQLFDNLEKFAFYPELSVLLAQANIVLAIPNTQEYAKALELILEESGLNYGNLPKGLIKFHSYATGVRSAAAEHLAEGAMYAVNSNNNVCIHFTVSPQHLAAFKAEVQCAAAKYTVGPEKLTFDVDYSIQKPETDTIAVNMDNTPFRDADGKLVFRPAGHGALLENLNEIDGDIIFIKNIDNIVPDSLKGDTVLYKKLIAGILLDVQEKAFNILRAIDSGKFTEVEQEAIALLKLTNEELDGYQQLAPSQKAEAIKAALNRPIRVCGMVKNQGEPGGGPFIAKNGLGRFSLQIVESSQIDLKNDEQKAIFDQATHFNPVDLVCGVRSYTGDKFDLRLFRDAETGFISKKSKDGKDLKAMELPGLWNGAMSSWITLFVEVPLITFNPVKTVNDLLRVEHQ